MCFNNVLVYGCAHTCNQVVLSFFFFLNFYFYCFPTRIVGCCITVKVKRNGLSWFYVLITKGAILTWVCRRFNSLFHCLRTQKFRHIFFALRLWCLWYFGGIVIQFWRAPNFDPVEYSLLCLNIYILMLNGLTLQASFYNISTYRSIT